jgi:hypothetical protein
MRNRGDRATRKTGTTGRVFRRVPIVTTERPMGLRGAGMLRPASGRAQIAGAAKEGAAKHLGYNEKSGIFDNE